MSEVNNKESLIIERNSRYKRFSVEQKCQFIAEASIVGNTMSLVSRKYGIASSCLYEWRRQMEEGALVGLKTGEVVVPLSEHKALKVKLCKLERMLGRKTIEVEIFKEAVELGREKTHFARTLARRGGFQVKTIASTLGVARSHLVEQLAKPKANRPRAYLKIEDQVSPDLWAIGLAMAIAEAARMV